MMRPSSFDDVISPVSERELRFDARLAIQAAVAAAPPRQGVVVAGAAGIVVGVARHDDPAGGVDGHAIDSVKAMGMSLRYRSWWSSPSDGQTVRVLGDPRRAAGARTVLVSTRI